MTVILRMGELSQAVADYLGRKGMQTKFVHFQVGMTELYAEVEIEDKAQEAGVECGVEIAEDHREKGEAGSSAMPEE